MHIDNMVANSWNVSHISGNVSIGVIFALFCFIRMFFLFLIGSLIFHQIRYVDLLHVDSVKFFFQGLMPSSWIDGDLIGKSAFFEARTETSEMHTRVQYSWIRLLDTSEHL